MNQLTAAIEQVTEATLGSSADTGSSNRILHQPPIEHNGEQHEVSLTCRHRHIRREQC